MEDLPASVKALLKSTLNRSLVCCTCQAERPAMSELSQKNVASSHTDGNIGNENSNDDTSNEARQEFFCGDCSSTYFCSSKCSGSCGHWRCRLVIGNWTGYLAKIKQSLRQAGYDSPESMNKDDLFMSHSFVQELVKPILGFSTSYLKLPFQRINESHFSPESQHPFYYNNLLLCLEGVQWEIPVREASSPKLADLALFMMILLGGDAQVMLDWLSYCAGTTEESETDGGGLEETEFSTESQEKSVHPLLALHGLFEQDNDTSDCTLALLYLLVLFRSLKEHKSKKISFQEYKKAVDSPLFYPPQLQELNDSVASFIWKNGKIGYEYGEAIQEEIRRIIFHIQKNKRHGTQILHDLASRASQSSPCDFRYHSDHFFPKVEAYLKEKAAEHSWQKHPGQDLEGVLWLLYSESFAVFTEGLDLNDFVPRGDDSVAANQKKND